MSGWSFAAASAAVDVRDRDRSAWSDVPKASGDGGRWSHHHRQLRSRGGDDSPANLVLLLGSGTTLEHGWVHANPRMATALGYMVASGADPALVPIYRVDAFGQFVGWHLQTADAQIVPCAPPEVDELLLHEALLEFQRQLSLHRGMSFSRL